MEPLRVAELAELFDREPARVLDAYRAGRLDDVRVRLGGDRRSAFDAALRTGDVAAARRVLVDAGLLDAAVPPTVTTVAETAPRVGPDPRGPGVDDTSDLVSPTGSILPSDAVRRERTALAIVGALVAVAVIALIVWLLVRDSGSNDSEVTVVADTAPATSVVDPSGTAPPTDTTPTSALSTAPTSAVTSTSVTTVPASTTSTATSTAPPTTAAPTATRVTTTVRGSTMTKA